MIDSIKNFAVSFEFYSHLALFTYWIPLAICFVTYFARLIKSYRRDLTARSREYYEPELTVGAIVLMFFLSLTPVINMFAMVFDCLDSVIKWIGRTLNFGLIPHRPDKKENQQ